MSILKDCKPVKVKKEPGSQEANQNGTAHTTHTRKALQNSTTFKRGSVKVQKLEKTAWWDPRPCFSAIVELLRVTLSIIAVSLSALQDRITRGIKTVTSTITSTCKRLVSSLVQWTPRKCLKQLLIFLCSVTPGLRNRRTTLLVFRNLPSRLTKHLLMQYFDRAPVWVISCHAKLLFLKSGPAKALAAVKRLLRAPVCLVEAVVCSAEGLLQLVVRLLKLGGRQQDKGDSKGRLLRKFSRQMSLQSSKKNVKEELSS